LLSQNPKFNLISNMLNIPLMYVEMPYLISKYWFEYDKEGVIK